ncbi:DUF5301 domain-containing protein [Anaerocolumna sp. MB42-C2]|uniref:DUF5301 domain-containing protein n=1 Tax=Anaerocolumna sp. MB42-C2 TaxID=3070997 RepID=UPI0027DFEB49|nr:DUF5301 domain-containing protein [Anaerocolumna sp. MB42-C2]WMJ89323.1 DUF5301 domain-containing protein [Anaerocolumna sp. MB42-C2]
MDRLFLTVLNMSLTASYVILFIMLVRLPLKKVPKFISYALWSVAAFRLVCPVSLESIFSLIPAGTASVPSYITNRQITGNESGINDTGFHAGYTLVTPTHNIAANATLPLYLKISIVVWVAGILVMLAYSIFSVISLKKKLQNARSIGRYLYEADNLKTPFVLGIIRPVIYIPSGLGDEEKRYIIRHEQTHIRRYDPLIKFLSYLILSIHWFNPLVWAAFVLMSTDMELSCDECVIKEMGSEIKKPYSMSLLTLASKKRIISGNPLAFGEGKLKTRIKNVLGYKKTAFGIVIAVAVIVGGIGIGLTLNPKELNKVNDNDNTINYIQIEVTEITDDKITGRIVMDKGDYKAGEIALVSIGDTVTYDVTSLKPGDWVNFGYDMASKYKPMEFEACELSIIADHDYLTTFTLFDNGAIIKSTTVYNPDLSAEIGSFILSGAPTLKRNKNDFFDTPNVSRYLKIKIGLGDDKFNIYYAYKKNEKYYIENPYDSIYEVSRETFDTLNEYLYKDEITIYPAEQKELEPAVPKWSPEQILGTDMTELDYASDDIVIFHGYFGLYFYDIQARQIIRSLDLKPLGCHQTQGDNYCEVSVSTDGNTVQLHPMSREEMYVYAVSDNTLTKTAYEPMKDRFISFVPIQEVIDPAELGSYSYNAVKFDNSDYGILHTYDWTLGTLSYTRGDMMYELFDTY